jgi:hypothetical protein
VTVRAKFEVVVIAVLTDAVVPAVIWIPPTTLDDTALPAEYETAVKGKVKVALARQEIDVALIHIFAVMTLPTFVYLASEVPDVIVKLT